jgi:hypothetical protein
MTDYHRAKVRNSAEIRSPVLNFVRQNYREAERIGGYVVLRPTAPSDTAATR